MHATRNYRIARTALSIAIALAAICFAKLLRVGITNPGKAKIWFGLLALSLSVGLLACLIFYYYRMKAKQLPNDEIALQALAAAGRNLARKQQRKDLNAPSTKPRKIS